MIARKPAVAGLFYPSKASQLRSEIHAYLKAVRPAQQKDFPKAIIAPHAGTVYSGPIAASAYAGLDALKDQIQRVILLGPAHRVAFKGLAFPTVDAFESPLGKLPLDKEAYAKVAALPQVMLSDEPHAQEHSLELQLPFLQELLSKFFLAPFAVGYASPEEVAEVLELLWGGPETLIVVSSDLSHYLDYATAKQVDQHTVEKIKGLNWKNLREEEACGFFPVRGLLLAAQKHQLRTKILDLRNSGDTAGDPHRVVGYGAFHFYGT